jgi:hypothetical protein
MRDWFIIDMAFRDSFNALVSALDAEDVNAKIMYMYAASLAFRFGVSKILRS